MSQHTHTAITKQTLVPFHSDTKNWTTAERMAQSKSDLSAAAAARCRRGEWKEREVKSDSEEAIQNVNILPSRHNNVKLHDVRPE